MLLGGAGTLGDPEVCANAGPVRRRLVAMAIPTLHVIMFPLILI
jgi:hypothetical protein